MEWRTDHALKFDRCAQAKTAASGMRPEAGLSGLSAPPVFELRLGEQKRRVFYAEIYPCGVLDFSQSGKPCPGGITVEQGGKERDLITRGHFRRTPGVASG
jgi:hypothetical protein